MPRNAIEIPSTTKEDLATFGGHFLVPMYSMTHPETGRTLWGLAKREFDLVQLGLACPECLADYGGIYRIKCPVCSYERDVVVDFKDEPDFWKPDPNDPDRRAA